MRRFLKRKNHNFPNITCTIKNKSIFISKFSINTKSSESKTACIKPFPRPSAETVLRIHKLNNHAGNTLTSPFKAKWSSQGAVCAPGGRELMQFPQCLDSYQMEKYKSCLDGFMRHGASHIEHGNAASVCMLG